MKDAKTLSREELRGLLASQLTEARRIAVVLAAAGGRPEETGLANLPTTRNCDDLRRAIVSLLAAERKIGTGELAETLIDFLMARFDLHEHGNQRTAVSDQ